MKLDPYKRNPPAMPVGLVTARRRVLLEDGSTPRLRDCPKGVRLYADAHLVNMRFLRRGDGWAHAWNERPVRWHPDLERSVILLQGYPGDGDDVMAGLVAWRDALASYGARIGSPASASVSLLRATLPRTIYLGGNRPRLSMVLGGRQESFRPPGVYGSFVHLDLSAAYARATGSLVYPCGWWREMGAGVLRRLPEPSELPMMARARVRLPAGGVGLLPVRPRRRPRSASERATLRIESPTDRVVQGTYNVAELRAAQAAGAMVKVLDLFVHVGAPVQPFERWFQIVQRHRADPGYAGALWKMTGNTLWGRFAIEGEMREVRYRESRPTWKVLGRSHLNPRYGADDVSELVASSIRARLLSELILPYADQLVGVHTDGGLVLDDPGGPHGMTTWSGESVQGGDWRVKRSGEMLAYLGPQMYASWSADGGYTYTCSGIAPEAAPGAFRELVSQSLGWPPPVVSPVRVERDRLRRLVRALGARAA